MTRKHPAAEVTAQDEDQTREVLTDSETVPGDLAAADIPLPSTAPAADLAGAAGEMHGRGIARIGRAETEQAAADTEFAVVLQRHAAERAQAEHERRERSAGAARDKSAGELDLLRAGWLGNAAKDRAGLAEDDATENALEAERATVLEQVGAAEATLAARRPEHQGIEAALAAAQQADDDTGAKRHQADLAAVAGIISAQERTLEAAQRRLTEIARLLTETRKRADGARATVARMLRDVWPDSPEAARWRQDQELQGAMDALLSYGRAEPQQPQRQITARTAGH